jgi:colanic acid/amylovoran biosynthesis protein
MRTWADWDDRRPGFVEIDLVGHEGGDNNGDFCCSLTVTDIATGWTENRSVRNKAARHVFAALVEIQAVLPFPLLGIDSDNGSDSVIHTGPVGGIQLCLAGAAIGNGNRGVEALGRSVLDVIDQDVPGSEVTVFDDGWGLSRDRSGRYPSTDVLFAGVRLSRRWHRPESWAQIRVAQALGGLTNPVARRIAAADAVLDISGGDSFTDIYGPTRLSSISAPKEAALRAGRPLVLLPQTYGPYSTAKGRAVAERLVRSAALAYARDEWSYGQLLALAGPHADRTRLHSGVDVAFALQPRRPAAEVADRIEEVACHVTAGVNASGLLRSEEDRARFGLASDYVDTITAVTRGLLDRGAHVVFVPHVHVPGGQGESDIRTVEAVRDRLSDSERSRTTVVPSTLDAAELKWCISRLDWFVGSRMHSTIGALSTGVPAFGYAYSEKTAGVFETCGVGDHVGDARKLSGPDAVEAMSTSFENRVATKNRLAVSVPPVIDRARGQIRDIVAAVDEWRADPAARKAIA